MPNRDLWCLLRDHNVPRHETARLLTRIYELYYSISKYTEVSRSVTDVITREIRIPSSSFKIKLRFRTN
jgi:hypothetical protein